MAHPSADAPQNAENSVAHPSRGAPQNYRASTYMWGLPRAASSSFQISLSSRATPHRPRRRRNSPSPATSIPCAPAAPARAAPPPEPRRRPPRGRARPCRRPSRAPASSSLPPLPSPPRRRHLPSPRRRAALGQARATDDLNSPSSPRYCPSLPPLPLLPWLHTRCLMKCGNKFSRFQLLVLSVFLSVVATVVASASNCTIVSLLETKKITKFS